LQLADKAIRIKNHSQASNYLRIFFIGMKASGEKALHLFEHAKLNSQASLIYYFILSIKKFAS
jgi:hypothetical protein